MKPVEPTVSTSVLVPAVLARSATAEAPLLPQPASQTAAATPARPDPICKNLNCPLNQGNRPPGLSTTGRNVNSIKLAWCRAATPLPPADEPNPSAHPRHTTNRRALRSGRTLARRVLFALVHSQWTTRPRRTFRHERGGTRWRNNHHLRMGQGQRRRPSRGAAGYARLEAWASRCRGSSPAAGSPEARLREREATL